ncbi:hypothetical protein [Polaromonas sp. YR568]|uniref:hypothetical protein n=1 Tax=Polaromonas sp. YR568 TaxID=1855301 RepID=UPI003137E5AA
MKWQRLVSAGALTALVAFTVLANTTPRLDLTGYQDSGGAITVLRGGDSTDPYFAMQALLLAHENGMDVSVPASQFADWLVPHQKPDGTFDRFCRISSVGGSGGAAASWRACKTADADDSLLAIWIKLLETMPTQLRAKPVLAKSHQIATASLNHLLQPSRGIYMVSPVYLHGLFMDNLEVWSLKAHQKGAGSPAEAAKLSKAIHDTFWDPVNKRFLVSTQLEQRTQKPAFYPDHVAQIFPLLVGYTDLPEPSAAYYRRWMGVHRAEWLKHSEADYPWGLLAVLALNQKDTTSARCWLRDASPLRHSARWAVTDEAAHQILTARGLKPATTTTACA